MPANPDSAHSRRPTLRDIAAASGVHVSTVSLVLSGSPKVAAVTAKRVRRCAERLGYEREPVYRALTQRRSGSVATRPPLIAVLTNRPTLYEFERVHHMVSFFEGASEQARALGYDCRLYLVRSYSRKALERELQRAGARGVILAAFLPHWPGIDLEWTRYAIAKIDSSYLAPVAPRVSHDQMQFVRDAAARLTALGFRRPGLAVGRFDEDSADGHYGSGWALQQRLLNLPPIPPLYIEPRESDLLLAVRLRRYIRRHGIDVMLSNWGNIANLVQMAGYAVPEDVGCACLCLDAPDPKLAGVVVDHRAVGRMAVDAVALAIQRGARGAIAMPPISLVAGEWRDGASAPGRVPSGAEAG